MTYPQTASDAQLEQSVRLSHTHKLVVGDWSSDGHGFTEDIYIMSNKTHDEIATILEDQICVSLLKQCGDYGDDTLDPVFVAMLLDLGIEHEVIYPDMDPESAHVDAEQYTTLLCRLMHYVDNSFYYAVYKPDKGSQFNIGGYGLFSH